MEKYDTSQLTEFPRFESESSQSGVTTFFNKIWKFPLFSPSESNENLQNKSVTDGKGQNQQGEDQGKQDYDEKTETGSYAVEFEGRSLPNVLRRISSLVALGSGGGTRYADTELARYWMPDDISRECYECAARFSTLRRRHHCRVCGQIFCSRCCSQRVPGQIFGCAGGLRVCNYCCKVVLSYLRENDMCGEISPDLRTLHENLQVKFPDNKSSLQSKNRDNFIFAREQEERCDTRASSKEALQDVFRQLSFTLPTQQHRYRLVRYNGVWRGCDILQWIMDNTNNKTRAQATQVCQQLVLAGYIECCTELPHFADYVLYKPIVLPVVAEQAETPEERTRLTESVSSYCLDLNLGEHSARLTKTAKTESKASPSSDEENPILEQTEGAQESRNVCKAIEESGEDHLKLMMRQCLAREGLSSSWLDVLYPLCQQAVSNILPDLFSNDIDVRNYVQVKKVPGGTMRDSCVVPGVMMTKNVVHRGMPQYINNPSILLLDCSIAYQRVEGKLTSLEPVLMQEQEYLVRCAARISALRPKVVFVKGTAARVVQDALRKEGVAMCVGVGARALSRAALTTGASLVTSVDARIAAPRLGVAGSFQVTNYTSKTLVALENCAEPHLGCCLLLRGASLTELIRVKKVARFMLLACYNWKLEKSFLNDIDAALPEPGMTFDDDDETNVKVTTPNDADIQNEVAIENETNSDELQLQDNNIPTIDLKTELITEKSSDTGHENNDKLKTELKQDTIKAKVTRKTDSDKNLSCGVPIRDFSDPLRSTLSVEDEVFLPKEETKLKADTHNDRWSTDDAVLSMSPNVVMSGAFLSSEPGRSHPLRCYFPSPLFHRPAPLPATPRVKRARVHTSLVPQKELHPFVRNAITSSVEDPALRTSLAHYRACGGRQPSDHKGGCPLYDQSILLKEDKGEDEERTKEKEQTDPLDPLAPENHQRLSLLFYSYSDKSANVPDFCVNPWIMTIELYGRKDITLGAFLEKYCFNTENKCPSPNCAVPMNQHVRRFVHNDVCITITCNTVGHSNVDKPIDDQNKQIMFRSWCGTCECGGPPPRRLSRRSLALSLGTYCAYRVRPTKYTRGCAHPQHTHKHLFATRLTTACFKYNKISTWEIELPAEVISIKYDTKSMRDALINQLNELMLKGHETFSAITDSEAEKDHLNFKQHMDHIHLALTSANLQEQTSLAGMYHGTFSAITDSEAEKDHLNFKQHMEHIHLALTSANLQEQTSLAGMYHGTFSAITDSEAEKDHLNFKQHMEHIHLALTSANLQEQTSLAGMYHGTFSAITDSEAEKDHLNFKQHMEHIHLALTSANLQEQTSLAGMYHGTFSAVTGSEAEKDHLNFKQHMEHIHLALTSANLQEQTSLAGMYHGTFSAITDSEAQKDHLNFKQHMDHIHLALTSANLQEQTSLAGMYHGTFSAITDSEAEKDHLNFKQHMEHIHLALTSANLQEQTSLAGMYHGTFSAITDSEAEKDHLNFKQHMEHIHLALTSANLQEQTSLAGMYHGTFSAVTGSEAEKDHLNFKQHMEHIHLALTSANLQEQTSLAGMYHGTFSAITDSEAQKDHLNFKQHMDHIHLALTSANLQEQTSLAGMYHGTFSAITDSEAEKDHLNFKQHMDHIHLALTSANLQEQTSLAGMYHGTFSAITDSEAEKDHLNFKQHMEHIHLALTSANLQEQTVPLCLPSILKSTIA